MNDNRRDALRAELPGPPAAHKLGLVDNMRHHPGAEQGEQAVAVLGTQEVARACVQAAMQPVDSVQPLNDAEPLLPEVQQAGQLAGGAGEQNRVEGHLVEVIADLDAACTESGGQFGLEGAYTAGIGRSRNDTYAWHEGIIP